MGSIDLPQAVQFIVILLISIDLHELAHAVTANGLGDPTPARNGQLSLNPFVHMDQIGVLVLIVSSLGHFPFAWGRTFIQPQNLRFGPQRGSAIVAATGPLTNLSLAAVLALGLRLAEGAGCVAPGSHTVLGISFDNVSAANFVDLAVYVNLALFVFNLIPLPPLDGFGVVTGFLSPRQLYSIAPLVQYGPLILLLLVSLSFLGNFNVLGDTVFNAVSRIGGVILPGFPTVFVCQPGP